MYFLSVPFRIQLNCAQKLNSSFRFWEYPHSYVEIKPFLQCGCSNPITTANFNGVSYTREMKLHKYLDVQRQDTTMTEERGKGQNYGHVGFNIAHRWGRGRSYLADYIQSFIVTGKHVILLDLLPVREYPLSRDKTYRRGRDNLSF